MLAFAVGAMPHPCGFRAESTSSNAQPATPLLNPVITHL